MSEVVPPRPEPLPRRIEPLYRPSAEDGRIIVYAGDLAVTAGVNKRVVRGQLELRLAPGSAFVAHFAGPFSELHFLTIFNAPEDEVVVSLPPEGSFSPPAASILPTRTEGASWVDQSIRIDRLEAGEATAARRFLVHIGGAFAARLPARAVLGGGRQPQVDFRLPGWELCSRPWMPPEARMTSWPS